jgi:hypothetical protein
MAVNIIGKDYSNDNLIAYKAGNSIIDYNTTKSAVPNSVTPGSMTSVNIQFNQDDSFLLHNLVLQMKISTSDATNSLNLMHYYLLFSEIRLFINFLLNF